MNPDFSVPDAFHPLIADWFKTRLGRPTDVQNRAWPKIMAGAHVLITGTDRLRQDPGCLFLGH